ncbi:MAG: HepT-like ribonuclease domain-containing protein [Thermomicrobiales bacterium]
MTRHDDVLYFGHMLDMARTARQIVSGVSRDQFDSDVTLQLALVRALEVIGEAGRNVTVEGRTSLPSIPWPTIIAMRHRLAHDYINVDLSVVWDTVHNDLPLLIEILEDVVPPRPPD